MEKWRYKRDDIELTSKFVTEMINQRSIVEYNKHIAYIDRSDQMKACNSSLGLRVKWYRK